MFLNWFLYVFGLLDGSSNRRKSAYFCIFGDAFFRGRFWKVGNAKKSVLPTREAQNQGSKGSRNPPQNSSKIIKKHEKNVSGNAAVFAIVFSSHFLRFGLSFGSLLAQFWQLWSTKKAHALSQARPGGPQDHFGSIWSQFYPNFTLFLANFG